MALKVVRNDNRFRIESQQFCTDWVSDTPENRKAMIVFLRLLLDYSGKALFTHQELAEIVESTNRQACSNHYESFVACGRDFLAFLNRKRKVNDEVCDALLEELKMDPLANISELKQKVNLSLNRNDLSDMNIKAALESISVTRIRGELKKRLQKGEAHYKEEYLLNEIIETFSPCSCEKLGITPSVSDGMKLSYCNPLPTN